MLSGDLAVLQAPMLDSLVFDPFALFDDACGPTEVGVGWRQSQARMISRSPGDASRVRATGSAKRRENGAFV